MKRKLLILGSLIAVIALLVCGISIGCKTTTAAETTVAETAAAETTVAETAAAETTVAETTAAEETPADVVGTITIWDQEVDNAFSASWGFAREQFKAKYPKVTVQYETKTFEQMVETAKMILNSDEVPDVMQCLKGNSYAGLYASEGLLTDLTAEAEARGWTDILSPSFQTTCRYDENGIMGSGNLYGVTNYGEFVMVYYNKDMFEKYSVEVPTSLAELEAVCDKFVAEGIMPITLGGLSGWPIGHDWYELLLYKADRDLINNYQLFQGDVDFQGVAYTFGAEKIAEWAKKDYFGKNALGISYDDANAAFVQGQAPMNITGSWWYGTCMTQVKDYDWGIFLLPGKNLYQGSGGDLWVVPEKAKNKDLAMEYIDLTMQKEAQTVMAEAGGIPINADLSQIADQHVLDLNKAFNSIVQMDGLAFYPDWPVPGYIDVLIANLQKLFAGTMTPEEFNNAISIPYNELKKS